MKVNTLKSKKELREEAMTKRLGLSAEEVKHKSHKIMSTFFSLDYYKKAKAIMFYVDMRNEVVTKEAIVKALSDAKKVAVPKVKKGNGLLAIEITNLNELTPGTFGVLEPKEKEEFILQDIDIVVVPGVVFDRKGQRIGYGAGYYDNFLPKLRPDTKKIAIAFEMQLKDSIPTEPHDIKMDMIITEEGIYSFNHNC